jgi:outer membrane protein
VLGVEERLASAKLQEVRTATLVATSTAALRSLLRVPSSTDVVLGDTLDRQAPELDQSLEELLREARDSRPELHALDARLAAASRGEAVARAALRPSVGLSASWELARPSSRYLPPEDVWHDTWSVGVAAAWKVFDGGRSRSAEAQASALALQLSRERDELLRQIDLEVETAVLALTSARAQVTAAEASRASAQERERAVRERHQAGLATISEVLDADTALAAAAQARIDAQAATFVAAARLARAIGQ